MHGVGNFTAADGTHYRGSWNAGVKQGLGRQLFAGGDSYEGLWRDGRPHGPGLYKWAATQQTASGDEGGGVGGGVGGGESSPPSPTATQDDTGAAGTSPPRTSPFRTPRTSDTAGTAAAGAAGASSSAFVAPGGAPGDEYNGEWSVGRGLPSTTFRLDMSNVCGIRRVVDEFQ